ncbi:hypothetical protein J6590_024599 [Homalodisca vitripennis]|nr:hypothetical protein J6590_024599 [Homalodisca vitripennis]
METSKQFRGHVNASITGYVEYLLLKSTSRTRDVVTTMETSKQFRGHRTRNVVTTMETSKQFRGHVNASITGYVE